MKTKSNWQDCYAPPDSERWQRQYALSHAYFSQHVNSLNLIEAQPTWHSSSPTFALLGVIIEEQSDGRQNGEMAAFAIRRALASLPLQNKKFYCYDVGDVIWRESDKQNQNKLKEVINLLLNNHLIPIVLAGKIATALAQIQAINHSPLKEKRLSLINFSADLDLTPSIEDKDPSIFYQIAQFQQAEKIHFDYNCIGVQHSSNTKSAFRMAQRLKTKIIFADELHQGLQEKSFDFIDRIIDENDLIYINLSLEVFASAFAPGVTAIQPLGLSPWQIIPLIRQLAASGKVVSYSLQDLDPRTDVDGRTTKLAALLIDEIVYHHHIKSC